MSGGTRDRLVAGWCLLTALGIGVYWITWFRTEHGEPWLPPGYPEHERVFVFTDTPLAVLLVVTATLLLRGLPQARTSALFTAGMLTFLGVIDLAYFALTGMFDPAHDGYANGFIVGAVLALALALVVAGRHPGPEALRRRRPRRP